MINGSSQYDSGITKIKYESQIQVYELND